MLKTLEALLALLLFLMGASVFSFLQVVAWRLPRGIDFVHGRSRCPACGRTLGPAELIPVFSYVLLRGRCRGCGARIPCLDWLAELLGGGVLLFCCWYYWPSTGRIAVIFAFLAVLWLIGEVDAATMEIPDGFVLALLAVAVASVFVFPEVGLLSRLLGFFAVSVPLLLLTLLIPGAFGGGDIKMMAACGAFLGWKLALITLAFAVLTGGLWGIVLLLTRRAKRDAHFAFGPFLCGGAAAALFVGQRCLDWYLGFFR